MNDHMTAVGKCIVAKMGKGVARRQAIKECVAGMEKSEAGSNEMDDLISSLAQDLAGSRDRETIQQLLGVLCDAVDMMPISEPRKTVAKSAALDIAMSSSRRMAERIGFETAGLTAEQIAKASVTDKPQQVQVPRHPDDRGGALSAAAVAAYTLPKPQPKAGK